MKKKKVYRIEPRRFISLRFLVVVFIAWFLISLTACAPQRDGCKERRGMIFTKATSERLKKFIDKSKCAWVYCYETKIVCVFNPEGKLIGYYKEKTTN